MVNRPYRVFGIHAKRINDALGEQVRDAHHLAEIIEGRIGGAGSRDRMERGGRKRAAATTEESEKAEGDGEGAED